MLSKNKIKYLQSLKNQKFREKYGKFIAEGDKLVRELINSDLIIEEIYSLKDWIDQTDIPSNINVTEIKPEELEKISNLTTPNKVIAVINIPSDENINLNFENDLILVLDQIKDPGNLGTIIRIADWFGIKNIVCSENTVEVYNPKVIQATMGSISRVKLLYKNLQEFFGTIPLNIPVYGSFLNGDNIYSSELTPNGLIIIGNESKGISDELNCFINKKITIPSFSLNKSAESLNASIATAIIISEFRRKHNKFISNQSFGNQKHY